MSCFTHCWVNNLKNVFFFLYILTGIANRSNQVDFAKSTFYFEISLLLYYLLYNYQRTLEETGKRGQETYYLKSCLQLSCCLAFHRLFECTGIKVCLITSLLVKPSSSRTLLVQTPQLTFVSRNRIPDISLHSSPPYDKGPHPR